MDLDKLADLARQVHGVEEGSWGELPPASRRDWRAAADAVRMACGTPPFESLPALRERLVLAINASVSPYEMKPSEIIERAKLFESYILGDGTTEADRLMDDGPPNWR